MVLLCGTLSKCVGMLEFVVWQAQPSQTYYFIVLVVGYKTYRYATFSYCPPCVSRCRGIGPPAVKYKREDDVHPGCHPQARSTSVETNRKMGGSLRYTCPERMWGALWAGGLHSAIPASATTGSCSPQMTSPLRAEAYRVCKDPRPRPKAYLAFQVQAGPPQGHLSR